MSFNGGDLPEADHIPGAFPSEEAVLATEKGSHNSQTSQSNPIGGNEATTGGHMDAKKREFLQQQEAAHTAGGRETNNSNPVSELSENHSQNVPSQHNTSNNSNNKTFSQEPSRAGLETPTSSTAKSAETPSAEQQGLNTQSTTGSQEEGSIVSNLATVATAVGLAAKDALFAAKDSAVPAANAATEQAKSLAGYAQENTAPGANTKDTANYGTSSGSRDTVPTDTALQTAGDAATYAKDAAYSAANTAQSYAPSVLGEPTSTAGSSTRDEEFPASQTGEKARETSSTPAPAVEEGSRQFEKVGGLLGQSQETKTTTTTPNVGSHAGLSTNSTIEDLEEQLAPESMTPGVVTVLGTEKDRSFPLGETDHVVPT